MKKAIVILALGLAVVGTIAVLRLPPKRPTHVSQSRAAIANLTMAADVYEVDTGQYPMTVQDLFANARAVPNWQGPYLDRSSLFDEWSNKLIYTRTSEGYRVLSAGRDQVLGTDDDITSF